MIFKKDVLNETDKILSNSLNIRMRSDAISFLFEWIDSVI